MIKALLAIRLKQIYRGLIEIGLFRLLFLIALLGYLGVFLYNMTLDTSYALLVSLGVVLLITMIQLRRGDKLFLKVHFAHYKLILLTEYALFSLPILCLLLIHGQWYALLVFLSLLIIVHLDLKPRYSSLNTKLQAFIPASSFEWKAGIRKQIYYVVPVWIIAAATSFFVASVPIAIFILGISSFSFYERCEPYQMILSYELSAKHFLFQKVKRQLQLFSIITLPLIVFFLIFNAELWYVPLAEFLAFSFIFIYGIMTKYAFYAPNTKSQAAQMFGSMGLIGGLIPVFLPVVWLLTLRFYIKSINNLNYYLDDYNK